MQRRQSSSDQPGAATARPGSIHQLNQDVVQSAQLASFPLLHQSIVLLALLANIQLLDQVLALLVLREHTRRRLVPSLVIAALLEPISLQWDQHTAVNVLPELTHRRQLSLPAFREHQIK